MPLTHLNVFLQNQIKLVLLSDYLVSETLWTSSNWILDRCAVTLCVDRILSL